MTTDGSPNSAVTDPLPDDVASCHAMIFQLLDCHVQKDRRIESLEHQVQQLLRRLYGRSAEKIDPKQLALFADLLKQIGQEAAAGEPEAQGEADPDESASSSTSPRKGHGRHKLPADLPRERIVHDLAEEQKPCPCCGRVRQLIGQESSEQLDYEPAKVKIIEHVRLKYACKECEAKAAETGAQIVLAAKPLWPIEKGMAAPGLLAYVMVSKYSDHLPMYRLEHILARHEIHISRSTMYGWAAGCAAALRPLYQLMVRQALASKTIHTDDTPVDVLDPALDRTRTGRFWVYVGDELHPYTVFDYTPSRSRDGPMTFLKDWGKSELRYLQADAFGGYDGIYRGEAGGNFVVEVACWSHARRKFMEAQGSNLAASAQALAYIRLLYNVERDARNLSPAQRARLRQERAAPVLVQFRSWLVSQQTINGGPVLPKSPMGAAITYALNQWAALTVYLVDGDLKIDNNTGENSLRSIALGRKNWLFCGSDNGGTTAAILFSILVTCQRHKINPFDYLRDVLTRIAETPVSRLPDLLPDRWKTSHPASGLVP